MKIIIEFQYFESCPHYIKMLTNLQKAMNGLEDKIEFKKVLVENEETARKVGFRGSPTIIIAGDDLESLPVPANPAMACRFYSNGIPSSEVIRKIIFEKIKKE